MRPSSNPKDKVAAPPRRVLEAKHPLAIRWFHWVNFPVLFIMIWSGLLIYWANDIYRLGIGNKTFFKFFPQKFYERFHLDSRLAEGMGWHFTFMWIFAINGLLYVLYLAFSGEWHYLLPGKRTLGQAIQVVLHDLHLRREPLPRAKFNGAQRIAYTGVVLMGLCSLLTGLAIYKPVQAALLSTPLNGLAGATGYQAARFLHFWLTIGFCLFFLVHVAQVARAGWNNFRAMVTGYELVPAEVAPPTASPPPAPRPGLPPTDTEAAQKKASQKIMPDEDKTITRSPDATTASTAGG